MNTAPSTVKPKGQTNTQTSLNASINRLPSMSFSENFTCCLSDSEVSLLHQFFFLLFLSNCPSVNPETTWEDHISRIIKVTLKQQLFRERQIAWMTAPQPKRTRFFSVMLKLFIQGPKRFSTSLGIEFKLRAVWIILQINLATEHWKNRWSMDSGSPQKTQLRFPFQFLLLRLSFVKILLCKTSHKKTLALWGNLVFIKNWRALESENTCFLYRKI